jgi:hypothetical protein
MENRNCKNCGVIFISKRNPNQYYCNKVSCQNARKNSWRVQKRSEDPDYLDNHKLANKNWRERNQKYWCQYRKQHPECIIRNRQLQRSRDKRRRCQAPHDLAKSDAFDVNSSIKSGTYKLLPINSLLAKSDALIVEISLIT